MATNEGTATFDDVQVDGYTFDVDYGYNGDTQIALTNITAIPEPGTIGMLGLGVAGLVAVRRRVR